MFNCFTVIKHFSEYEKYLPSEKFSVKFKCKTLTKQTVKAKQADHNENVWGSLPLFGSTGEIGNDFNLFCYLSYHL